MFCTNCGNKLLDEAKFCDVCGAQVDNHSVSQAPEPIVEQTIEQTEVLSFDMQPEQMSAVAQQEQPIVQPVEQYPPQQAVYVPQQEAYASQQTTYVQQQEVNIPQQPVYVPEQPVYMPQQPVQQVDQTAAQQWNVQPVPVQTAYPAPQKPVRTPNPMFGNFIGSIKDFFSKDVVKGVGGAAKSTSLEWILFAAVSIVAYALAASLNINRLFVSMGVPSMQIGQVYSTLGTFALSLLVGIASYGTQVVALWGGMLLFFKKNVNLMSVFNMVSVATIPLSCVYIANIILGFIWLPVTAVTFITAIMMSSVLLYVGFQKLEKINSTPYFVFSLAMVLTVVVTAVVAGLLYMDVIETAKGLSQSSSGLLDSLGDIGNDLLGGLDNFDFSDLF